MYLYTPTLCVCLVCLLPFFFLLFKKSTLYFSVSEPLMEFARNRSQVSIIDSCLFHFKGSGVKELVERKYNCLSFVTSNPNS